MASVVVVTPNPAIDVTYQMRALEPGESNRVRDVRRAPGGKGVNVCRALNDIGISVVSVCPLGGWTGDWIRSQLQQRSIPERGIHIDGETRLTTTVIQDIAAHPTVILEPGPLLATEEWAALTSAIASELENADALVIAGSLPPGADESVVEDWARAASSAGVRAVVDTSGAALLAAARARVSVAKANAQEAQEATRTQSISAAAERLLDIGAQSVVISDGIRGLHAFAEDGAFHVPAVPGVSGNPTGAGDAATAGLVAALIEELGMYRAITRAAALGAAAVLRPVAGEVDVAAYQRFMAASLKDYG